MRFVFLNDRDTATLEVCVVDDNNQLHWPTNGKWFGPAGDCPHQPQTDDTVEVQNKFKLPDL